MLYIFFLVLFIGVFFFLVGLGGFWGFGRFGKLIGFVVFVEFRFLGEF